MARMFETLSRGLVPIMRRRSSSRRSLSRSAEDLDPTAVPEVRAAGGIVWRLGELGIEVVIVHRPKYSDWTFPKGKLDPGESDESAAHREVLEETGFECVLGRELPSVRYSDAKARLKQVRYWEMTIASGDFEANDEVDELLWATIDGARKRLTHIHDIRVLEAFARLATP
jgi:8-oxo-dGTP diphosphatase